MPNEKRRYKIKIPGMVAVVQSENIVLALTNFMKQFPTVRVTMIQELEEDAVVCVHPKDQL
jgi:hypothetical protein